MKALIYLFPLIIVLSACGEQGQVEIQSDKEATVFVDGKKKAMTGTNGTVTLTVSAGEHTFGVERFSTDGLKRYSGEKQAFIGADTQNTLRINTNSELTAKGIAEKRREEERLAKRRAEEERWWNIAAQHNRWATFTDPDPASATVKDPLTGLEWMRCSLGQTWTGSTCSGTATTYTWDDAKEKARNLTFANHSDWRLPTVYELHSLVYCSSGQRSKVRREDNGSYIPNSAGECKGSFTKPTIQSRVFPNTELSYWSGSPVANYRVLSWIVYFAYGYEVSNYRDARNHVRLVRSEK